MINNQNEGQLANLTSFPIISLKTKVLYQIEDILMTKTYR